MQLKDKYHVSQCNKFTEQIHKTGTAKCADYFMKCVVDNNAIIIHRYLRVLQGATSASLMYFE